MIVRIPNLHMGYFTFNDPTLLLAGDRPAADALSKLIQSGEPFCIEGDVGEQPISLTFSRSAKPSRQSEQGGRFTFTLDEELATEFFEKLRHIHLSDCPCHDYLDPEINETPVTIVVSLEEYSFEWLKRASTT